MLVGKTTLNVFQMNRQASGLKALNGIIELWALPVCYISRPLDRGFFTVLSM